tara:strand:+ start:151 stop:423 length:273 start_codon:yes stop_codon:yes gene_type:complete
MTEYTDIVEKRRIEMEASEWGKRVKYIHYNSGVETLAYNDGTKKLTDINSGKVTWDFDKSELTLLEKFRKWKSDRNYDDGYFRFWSEKDG